MNQEFNLIDEPWICVRTKDCTVKEVGLKELFFKAHEYVGLAGETKTQDFAVLRFLLAIMHTVFARYDAEGNRVEENSDIDLPMQNWQDIWENKQIPQAPINDYFETWRDRFWLFDEKYPFYQSNEAKTVGSMYSSAKMIGSLVESANKFRLFSEQVGYMGDKARIIPLKYAQAARWLINLQCFDDIAAKKNMQVPKQPWVGKLHLIAIEGNNLFETLMLNYVADYDKEDDVTESPSWEWDEKERKKIFPPDGSNCVKIKIPNNQAELLTLQSRCVYLVRENGQVIGYHIAGGAYFEEEDFALEQMTLWRYKDDKFKPQRYDRSKLIWQEFGSIVSNAEKGNNETHRRPGVIEWFYHELLEKEVISSDYRLKTMNAAVIYNYNQSTSLPVIDVVSDSLNFQAKLLLEDVGQIWCNRINTEIGNCENAAKAVAYLSINLQKAAGASGDNIKGDEAKREFYHRIDSIFRLWLAELSVEYDEKYISKLETDLFNAAFRLGREMVAQVSDRAIFGYMKNDEREPFSAARASERYEKEIAGIFNLRNTIDKKGEIDEQDE